MAELLRAGRRKVYDVWMAEGADRAPILDQIVAEAERRRVPVRHTARVVLDREAATESPQGVLAHAAPVPEADFDRLCHPGPGLDPDDADDGPAAKPFLLALDGVTDPRNLGALLRSADGAGATGAILTRRRSAHVTPAVTKAAAGAVEHVALAVVPGLPAALARAKELGCWVVGLADDGDASLFDLNLATEPLVLVVGSEGDGLSRLVRQRCDLVASIPMAGALPSLNVAAAGTLALYEVARRRGEFPFRPLKCSPPRQTIVTHSSRHAQRTAAIPPRVGPSQEHALPFLRSTVQVPDDILVARCHLGEEDALNLLLERYRRFVQARARGYFMAGGGPDDLEQEGMIGLFKAVRDYRPDREASFRAFAELCVTRQLHTAIKTATRQKHRPLNQYISLWGLRLVDDPGEPLVDELPHHQVPDPADELVSSEDLAAMQASLARTLSELEVDVLALYVEGRSYQEIGDRLGRQVKSIDNALQRVKRKLEGHLAARSADDAAVAAPALI